MVPEPSIAVWRPRVAGVREVLHAHFPRHAYPLHTHDTWTVLVVDAGTVVYDLGRHRHATRRGTVTVLPPGVPHDGSAATPEGFRKRVLYLEPALLDVARAGCTVDAPEVDDAGLHAQVDRLHDALRHEHDAFEAEARLALARDRLAARLGGPPERTERDPGLAGRLRAMLDDHVVEGLTLADAAVALDAAPSRLVRSFGREVGMPPHRYLVGRRLDAARRLLLEGRAAADVAVEAGFHDQAHLTRHFKRFLGVTPGAYAGAVRRG